ncbi:uncharacterized protein LY89DRAFT_734174 [Mollisia scopiformis]|uniref:Rhodopsin domain-containing protein n=1 Tax=Mollisia scopiformis TaxID=149040 RepID=A0A194XAJ8_MOLSC|nr:uncharacterized protein LY89DRAFT_734174 [Mollisia scopiformis]KUJ17191.1 hypothetical protein LY89DRAFT_734174 [Mollisia scopiformis]
METIVGARGPDGPDISIAGPMMRTIWILYGITFAVVILRLYTQWRITCSLGLGDAIMALSLLCGTGILTTLTIQHHYGLGRHFSYLDPHQKVEALYFNFIGQPLGRHSLLRERSIQQHILNFTGIMAAAFVCKDPRTLWDPIGHPGYCWRPFIQEYTGFAQGAINSATDLFLTILPIRIFYTLKMSIHLKLGLGFLLGLSAFAFVASIIKTVELKAIGNRGDFTFGTVDFFTWVIVEFTLVDIAASAPLALPLFRRLRKPPPKNSYQLQKPYGGHSIVILGGKSAHPQNRNKSRSKLAINDLETTILNSSEDNILTLVDDAGERAGERDLPRAAGRAVDLESGARKKVTSPVCDGKTAIIKQTSFDVSFKVNEGEGVNIDGTRRRDEMWMTKELPKIPWEAQVKMYKR